MGRSPGFGSAAADSLARFGLGFPPAPSHQGVNLAGNRDSPDRSTKSTRSRASRAPAACGRGVSGSLSLPSRGPFHLSLTVLCSIGHQVVFSLAGWSPLLPARFHVPRGTLDPAAPLPPSPTGLSPSPAGLSRAVPLASRVASRSPYPGVPGTPVWAPPGSLAATSGIDVSFFSSGYLDVSVRRVPPARLSRVSPPSARGGRVLPGRVSPFRHPRVYGHLLLSAAFRSLSRLSSALGAKASAPRPFSLGPLRRV